MPTAPTAVMIADAVDRNVIKRAASVIKRKQNAIPPHYFINFGMNKNKMAARWRSDEMNE